MKDKTLSSKIRAHGFPSCNMDSKDVKEFIQKIADKSFVIDGFSDKARIVVDIEDVKELAGDDLIHSQHPSAGDEADRVSLQSLGEKPTKTEDTPGDAVNSGHLASDNKGFEDVMDIDDIKRGSGNKGCTNYEK